MKTIDHAWDDFSERFRREALPAILDSSVFLSIGGHGLHLDVKQAAELGAALLMGKPLLIVSLPGVSVSDQLRRAADEIIEDWDPGDLGCQDRVADAIKRLAGSVK
jgi:hypothetical protein